MITPTNTLFLECIVHESFHCSPNWIFFTLFCVFLCSSLKDIPWSPFYTFLILRALFFIKHDLEDIYFNNTKCLFNFFYTLLKFMLRQPSLFLCLLLFKNVSWISLPIWIIYSFVLFMFSPSIYFRYLIGNSWIYKMIINKLKIFN